MKKSIIILLSLIWGLEICARDFVHPGGVHTINDLERIKEKVLAKESPWIDGWNLMIQDSKAQYTYKAAPAESVSGPSGRRQRAARDGVAAYYNFLRWYVTGDERHAQCAVDILNAWSSSVDDVITGELFQLPANIFVEVAEVVRAYSGWKEEDIERFKKMCKEYFYPACRDFLGECGSWSGWDGPANTCNMAIGIFCDDEAIYNEALEYYKSGSGGGCLTQMVNPLTFQVNEMGRDTPHAEIGPGSAAELCQMAWNQGDDLFGLEDNLLLKGFEYLCRFNLTHEYDRWEWDTKEDCANRFFYYPASCWRRTSGRSFAISNMPANEIIYNHYVVRKGLEAPWTEAMIKARGLTACGWEAPGYVAFTYTLDAGKSPFHSHVLPLAPEQVKAVSGLEEVVVSWMPHEGDVVNGAVVERASSPEGPFTEVGRWNFNTTRQYADTTVQGGRTYYYRVAEVNKAGTGAYSKSVKATPYQGTPLPEGWQLTNFGYRELGAVVYHDVNGHTFAIQGTGTSFGGSSDNVTYVYTPVRKNTTLIVRLFDSVNTDEKSERAGLMMRESLEPGARMASVGLADTGFRYVWFAPRTVAGRSAAWIPGNTHTWLEVWFKLTREGDYVYGRGTTDDKGPVLEALYAMKLLRDSGVKLNKRVRLIMGCNEETGSKCMAHYNEVEEELSCGFTPDANFPCIHGEKGHMSMMAYSKHTKIFSMNGGFVTNAVCDSCTTVIPAAAGLKEKLEKELAETKLQEYRVTEENGEITIYAKGVPAHASTPTLGVNAAGVTFECLEKAGFEDDFVTFYNTHLGTACDGSGIGLKVSDAYGDLTFCNGIVKTQDGVISCTIDIRVPVTLKPDEVRRLCEDKLEDENGRIEILDIGDGLFFPRESPLVEALYKAYVDVTGDTANEPMVIGGGTYAKSLKNIIAFGPEKLGIDYRIHGADEYILVSGMEEAVLVYMEAIKNLLAI